MKKICVLLVMIFAILSLASCKGHEHRDLETWEKDANEHWNFCSDCEEVINKSSHTFEDWVVTKDATCIEEGSMYRICSVCEYKEIQKIEKESHEYSTQYESDASQHWVECECGIKATGTHTYGEWKVKTAPTCQEEGIKHRVCSVCGYEQTTILVKTAHNYSEEYQNDDNNHWQECECGDITDYAEHTYGEWEVKVSATCTEEGIKQKICIVCGHEKTSSIAKISHEYSDEYKSDDEYHWFECECGKVDGYEEHSGGIATTQELAKCKKCGVPYGDYAEVDPWQSNASPDIQSLAEDLLYTKHRLTYNEDGSFRVLIIADAHMNVSGDSTDVQEVKDRIKLMVDRINPNLVIFTGDNTIVSSSQTRLRSNINALVSYIEEKQIPWCHVYGNHDHEGALTREEQQKVYESFEYCISKDTDNLSGVGNYVHGVYNKDGSLGSVIYCLDSGAYVASGYPGYYDFIKEDQIAWYKETSEIIQEYNNGELVRGMMAFHIPLLENKDADLNKDNKELVYEYTGAANEAMCPSAVDTNLLETIWERGDIKAIVSGHDHKNDYMFNYKGVKLTSSPNISDLTYYDANFQGSRVFDLNVSTLDNIPTYVSYLIERINPDDYDHLESNITIEDFNSEINEPIVSGWAGQSLTGTASISLVGNKGVGNSTALEISRGSTSNFEFVINIANPGKLGSNKYVIFWFDFTNVEFRKACIGLSSNSGAESPFRTDDNDITTKFYYLADGSSNWQELTHGGDGCFGEAQDQLMKGKKGYFAFSVSELRQGSNSMTEDSLVLGLYFYGSLSSDEYINVPFYMDNIILCEDYKTIELPSK